MGDSYNEKDFEHDLKIAYKIVEKADNKGYEFSNLEISVIKNITCAKSYKDVNVFALRLLYNLANKLKVKY